MKTAQPLLAEFNFYIEHQDELVRKFNGKFVVIKGSEVLGAYDKELEAITEGEKHWDLGTFMVQKCEPGPDNYTAIFHSRAGGP
jgi:hypothetical protein